ncbi:hypothetical protein BH20ACT3_BH20ACT3_06940 [soil metagenome]
MTAVRVPRVPMIYASDRNTDAYRPPLRGAAGRFA